MSGHTLLLNIIGGVALLLWATRMIRTGILRAWGGDLRRWLGRSAQRRLNACGVGIVVAGILQSSTATGLLVASFATEGLLTASAGLAIMLGADIGSTIVVQVLSFDLRWLSPALVAAGVITFLVASRDFYRHIGRIILGLGLMLLSLGLVVGASEPLRDSAVLKSVVAPLAGDPVLAVLLAALLTWLAHSSVAMVLLFMTLAMTGVVPLGLACALVLGANLGSGIIPLALAYSSGSAARRILAGNLLFRFLGVLLALPLIDFLLPLVAYLGDDASRQIANVHTAFNLALAAIFLPLIGWFATLLTRVFADSPETEGAAQPRHLDAAAIETPPVAIGCAAREVMHMADLVESMLRGAIEVFRRNDMELLERLSQRDDEVDDIYEAVKLYLIQISRKELSEDDSRRCVELISFTTNLEHIGDIIDKNLLDIAQKKIRNKLMFSKEGWEDIERLHARVVEQMQRAMSVYVSGDLMLARQMLTEKDRVRELERESSDRHLERLRSGRTDSIETSALHIDILRDLKRINSHLTGVAYPILDANGELRKSRLVMKARTSESAATEADERDGGLALEKRS